MLNAPRWEERITRCHVLHRHKCVCVSAGNASLHEEKGGVFSVHHSPTRGGVRSVCAEPVRESGSLQF